MRNRLLFYLMLRIVFFSYELTVVEWDRENLIEELLKEPDEIAIKRKRTRETLHILQQANRVKFKSVGEGVLQF